jgi:hypothetical protein
MLLRVVWHKLTDVSDVITLKMETVSASETPVNSLQTTRREIPEDSCLRIRRRKNLKSHQVRCTPESTDISMCVVCGFANLVRVVVQVLHLNMCCCEADQTLTGTLRWLLCFIVFIKYSSYGKTFPVIHVHLNEN